MDLKPVPGLIDKRSVLFGVIALGAVIFSSANGVWADEGQGQMDDLEKMRELAAATGAEYLKLRDEILQGGADINALRSAAEAPADWDSAVVLDILDGWRAHESFYAELIEEIDDIDIEGQSRKVTGVMGIWELYQSVAKIEYGTKVLPLSWEALVKLQSVQPDWKTATYLAMLAGVPDEGSIRPIVHLIASSESEMIKERAVHTLTHLPSDAVRGYLLELAQNPREAGEVLNFIRMRLE